MYILKYAAPGKEVDEILDRLNQLSLAYRVEESVEVKDLTLQEGKQVIIGQAKINAHLEELTTELHQWYYCDC